VTSAVFPLKSLILCSFRVLLVDCVLGPMPSPVDHGAESGHQLASCQLPSW
jgi:hypothetical protein